jgi:sigma-B regulation protein RsbU (phosphoserine phosphatase)
LKEGSTVLGAFEELPFLNVGVIEDLEKFVQFVLIRMDITEIHGCNKNEEFGDVTHFMRLWKGMHLTDSPSEMNEAIIETMKAFKGENSYMDDITLASCCSGGTIQMHESILKCFTFIVHLLYCAFCLRIA